MVIRSEHGWVCDVCDSCKRREGVLPGGRGLKKVCSAKKQLERAAAAAAVSYIEAAPMYDCKENI